MADRAAARAGLVEPGSAEVGCVDGDDRRALGHAVAFQRPDAEGLLEGPGDRLGQLVGAGDDQPQRAELRRGTAPGVNVKERRRGEQDRGLVLLDERADGSGLLRFDMADQPHAAARSQPEQQVAERVEQRQDVEDPVGRVDVEDLADGLDVRNRC